MYRSLVMFFLLVIIVSACRASTVPADPSATSATAVAQATETTVPSPTVSAAPVVVIEAPPSNATGIVGERMLIQSTSTDDVGIARVELQENGTVVRNDNTPEQTPQKQFSLLQPWEPAAPGEHILRVTAFRADGTASDPASILIVVEEPPATEAVNTEAVETASCTVTSTTSLNVRLGPGAGYQAAGVLALGHSAAVTGKYTDGSWWQIEYEGTSAWVAASHSYTDGNCQDIPVMAAPALPADSNTTPSFSGATATKGAVQTPAPSITPGGPTLTPSATSPATLTGTATPSSTATPTQNPTTIHTPPPTGGPTLTYTPLPTSGPTATSTATPTTLATGTPTPTTSPTLSPTATASATVAAWPEAPPDPRFNNPLTIPLDSTISVTDFVSYPGGDTEDRVRWDITGMNPNVAISGGRARLLIAASCFGTNTQQIQFFTGGQTFTCGQTIVDREVTYDSRTGSVIITAIGGEGTYIQWVLTGTATTTE